MVGESFEQTEKMNSGLCGKHFTAEEHFVDDESFAIVNCGELFTIGENFELSENVLIDYSGEHLRLETAASCSVIFRSRE